VKYSPNLIIKTFVIFLVLGFLVYNIPTYASPDAIWTTKDDCGDEAQDVNHFAIGDHVYINGEGFSPDSYSWTIKGKPGGASCDPNIIVASGTVVVDSSGSFCFDAYTVASDDCGEYQVKLDTKGDNYRVTPGVFDCSDYTTQEDCDYYTDCEWCYECDGKKWSGGPDRCVDAGTCNYECFVGECDAECLPGQTDKRCLPEGTVIYYCLNYISYEIPEFDTCNENCEWDNCTEIVTEDDPRCYERLPRPSCDGGNLASCFNYIKPSFDFQRPSFDLEMPSFDFETPSFDFEKPSFEFTRPDFSSYFNR